MPKTDSYFIFFTNLKRKLNNYFGKIKRKTILKQCWQKEVNFLVSLWRIIIVFHLLQKKTKRLFWGTKTERQPWSDAGKRKKGSLNLLSLWRLSLPLFARSQSATKISSIYVLYWHLEIYFNHIYAVVSFLANSCFQNKIYPQILLLQFLFLLAVISEAFIFQKFLISNFAGLHKTV